MEYVDQLDPIVGNMLSAVPQVRNVISLRTRTEDVFQAFWSLQDHTDRLLAHVVDEDVDWSVLDGNPPNLVPTIVDVLGQARKSTIFQIVAVTRACGAINRSLLELQRIKSQRELARMPAQPEQGSAM